MDLEFRVGLTDIADSGAVSLAIQIFGMRVIVGDETVNRIELVFKMFNSQQR